MGTSAIEKGYGDFLEGVSAAEKRVLLLDYDGTLAPFSPDRDRAFPYPVIPGILRRIMSGCATRLVLISDRTAQELPLLVGLDPPPEIWGSHGLQRIHADGHYQQTAVDAGVLRAIAQAEAALTREGLAHRIEPKLASLAVHWRGLQPAQILEVRSKAYRVLEPLASRTGLCVMEFDGGVAVRLPSANKGAVIRTLLSEIAPGVPVAYAGDDISDEYAFRALNGRGLTVRAGPQQRVSAAQVWLRQPQEMAQFLTGWIRACGGYPWEQESVSS